jgi:putative toxin-antitoxin system antitoxin component (TIGR02293 family)
MAISEADHIARLLGGKRVLGRVPRNTVGFVENVREGLPYAAVEKALAQLHLATDEVWTALRQPKRTMARRREQGRLDPVSSEAFLRLVRVAARAIDLLGSDRALRWLRAPIRALGGVAPLSLLDTDLGAEAVLDVLDRVSEGVFS